jgi:hypothetical protein
LSPDAVKDGAGFKVTQADGAFMFYVTTNVRMGMVPRAEGIINQINSGLALKAPEVRQKSAVR